MADTVHKTADEKFCTDCGSRISARAEICPKCGVRQMPPPGITIALTPNGRSRLVAALLALFLGGFGIHKFYLGRIGWGVVFLFFCWTFLPALVGFVEGILLLVMSDDAFAEQYGKG